MLRSWARPTAHRTLNCQIPPWRRVVSPVRLAPLSNAYATITNLETVPNVGDKAHGFTVQATKNVPELHLTAIRLQHDRTGADYLHIARDDSNNVFSIGFKTNPPDDTGVPHILEHTTLCGSRKYPVRDPFFKMLPRSLSTFMNAFTSADNTIYPFSTTNSQDFKNLMSVYLDATLFPLLKQEDFRQEGWRLAHVPVQVSEGLLSRFSRSKLAGPFIFKGVVYNEMKGMMSDAGYVYQVRWRDHIFPALHNSGGDPQKITDLTYENLVDFHTQNYHPSNAKLFTYGNMPLEDHLQQIGQVLGQFSRRDKDEESRLPLDLNDGPHYVKVPGPVDVGMDSSRQHKTSITWLTGDTTNVVETFALGMISSLLFDGYGAPLHKALIESGLGSHFTPNVGFDSSSRVGIFSIGLGGVAEQDVPKVKEAITATLENVVFQGVDDVKVQGFLHQMELGLKHRSTEFGLETLQKLMPRWFNGTDPMDMVGWNDVVSEVKRNYEEEGYLEGLIIRHLLNDRYLSFTMEPSPTYHEGILQEELSRAKDKFLETTRVAGSPEVALEQIQKNESNLIQVQDAGRVQDLSCLPSLKTRDIAREERRRPLTFSRNKDVKIQWRETSTNGLTYFAAFHAFDNLPPTLRVYLSLFLNCLMRLGTRDQSMEELEDTISLKTGGISFSRHTISSPSSLGQWSEGLLCRGYALDHHVPILLQTVQKLIMETDFSGPRARGMIKELIRSNISGIVDDIAASGNLFATVSAVSSFREKHLQDDNFRGMSHVQFLLTQVLEGELGDAFIDSAISRLIEIQSVAISKASNLKVAITCEPSAVSANEASLNTFLSALPHTPSHLPEHLFTSVRGDNNGLSTGFQEATGRKVFYNLPYQVHYTAAAAKTEAFTHPSIAPLTILAQLLSHKLLHHEIREKGGAYGGGASLMMHEGYVSMSSYRDPNPQNSLQVMLRAGQWATEQAWTEQDLAEAKLSAFQVMDAPVGVHEEGDRQFLRGVSDDMAQTLRERLLDVTASEVKEAAQKYLVEGAKEANLAVIGPWRDWPKLEDGWAVQNPVPIVETEKSGGWWKAIATGAFLSWLF